MQQQRAAVLDAAYRAPPERFKGKVPTPPALPTMAGINVPKTFTPVKEIFHNLNVTPDLLTNFSTQLSQSH